MGAAKTGSGKTLAFLIPCIEMVSKLRVNPRHGTVAIVLAPTRELALQTYCVLRELMQASASAPASNSTNSTSGAGGHTFTFGLIMGGTARFDEVKRLAKGFFSQFSYYSLLSL